MIISQRRIVCPTCREDLGQVYQAELQCIESIRHGPAKCKGKLAHRHSQVMGIRSHFVLCDGHYKERSGLEKT